MRGLAPLGEGMRGRERERGFAWVYGVCLPHRRGRDEVNLGKLEFLDKARWEKEGKIEREREFIKWLPYGTFLSYYFEGDCSLSSLSNPHMCQKRFCSLYRCGLLFFYMWSIVMVLAHDSYRIKIPWFVLPWSLFNSLHTLIPLILAYKVLF